MDQLLVYHLLFFNQNNKSELSRELEKYTLMHIPFYYDDEGNMHNKTENRSIMHTFSCEYHGDGNVDRVIWTVLSENGTDVELGINNNSVNFQEVTVELKIRTSVPQ